MHIVTAFEQAQRNRDEVHQIVFDMMVQAAREEDTERVAELKALADKVQGILKPLTD